LVLLHNLPPESALNTAIRNATPEQELADAGGDPVTAKWSTVEMLLATLIDETRNLRWVYTQSHSDNRVPRPEPILRPGVRVRARKQMSLEEAQRIDPRLRGLSPEDAQDQLDKLMGRR
jgi:hypothetical protein